MNSLKHIYCMKCGEQLVANNDTSIEKLSRLRSIRNVKKKHFFKGPIKKKQSLILMLVCLGIGIEAYCFLVADKLLMAGLVILFFGGIVLVLAIVKKYPIKRLISPFILMGVLLMSIGYYQGRQAYVFYDEVSQYSNEILWVTAFNQDSNHSIKWELQEAVAAKITRNKKAIAKLKYPRYCQVYRDGLLARMNRLEKAVSSGDAIDNAEDQLADFGGQLPNKSRLVNYFAEREAAKYEKEQEDK